MIFADLFGDLSHGDRRHGLGTDMMAMITKHASFAEEAPSRTLAAMGSGRPEAYIDCWAKSGDTTLFGAWDPIEKGYRHLAKHSAGWDIFHWRHVSLGGHRLV